MKRYMTSKETPKAKKTILPSSSGSEPEVHAPMPDPGRHERLTDPMICSQTPTMPPPPNYAQVILSSKD